MKYKNESGIIELDCNLHLSKYALDIYKEFNPKEFNLNFNIPLIYSSIVNMIGERHEQKINTSFFPLVLPKIENNNKVLLAISGGLDSVYQLLYLRYKGYDITLFHIKNLNFYTNGQEFKVVNEISKRFNLPLIIAEFKQNTKKGDYKKYWKENSFKNTLFYSMMVDYCIENDIQNISSGDDLRLDIKDTIPGTNVSDARQITISFFTMLNNGIEFIPIPNDIPINTSGIKQEEGNIHKGLRLKELKNNNLLDDFYSCVNPGRLNQYNHNRIEEKYNVKLEKYNCGVCRKCAFHSLLRHYYLNQRMPEEFIEFCWNKIANGADYEFFKPSLPLEQRITNLFNY